MNNMNSQKIKIVAEDMNDIKKLLDGAGITFWLMSGSMLGCVMIGEMLPEDRDIDLGIWDSYRPNFNKLIPRFEKLGFMVKQRYDPAFFELKGMVTLKREGGVPIDIKFYREKQGYAIRSIHKSDSRLASLAWVVADLFYFKKWPSTGLLYWKFYFFKKPIMCIANHCPITFSKVIIRLSCFLWMLLPSRYGREVVSSSYFKNFDQKEFCGIKVNIPADWENYFWEEYGENWNSHDPSGKGGWNKQSHIIFPKEKIKPEDFNDNELLNRYRIAGFI